jgi:GNAT superfamily N-acetyltransferase
MDLTLRSPRTADAPALAAISADGFDGYVAFAPAGWAPPPDTRATFERDLLRQLGEASSWGMLAEVDGDIAGHAAFVPASASGVPVDDPQLAHLWQLFVAQPYWGRGVATTLHDAAVRAAAGRGFTQMRLFTPAGQGRARRFYEREGWTLAGPGRDSPMGLAVVEYRRQVSVGGA